MTLYWQCRQPCLSRTCLMSCCSRCVRPSVAVVDGAREGRAGGGISSDVSSGASGRVDCAAPGIGTGVEERSSPALPVVLVEYEVEDSAEGDLLEAVEGGAGGTWRSRSSRSSKKRMTPPEPTPRIPLSMMLKSVGDRELMMAPINTLLGSRCGAGIAGRKFSDAEVGC